MPKILFSNIGYARGIDGSLLQNILLSPRFLYSPRFIQKEILKKISTIISRHDPDLCCFVEINRGGRFINSFNQLHFILNDSYPEYDISDKYGAENPLRWMPFHIGKSNAFMAKKRYDFNKRYFEHGSKRLIYEIKMENGLTILFTHFSLKYETRKKQFNHITNHLEFIDGPTIILADFNIFKGIEELNDFLSANNMVLINREDQATFTNLKNKRLPLDLCLSTKDVADEISLDVIDQPFSDHDALLVEF